MTTDAPLALQALAGGELLPVIAKGMEFTLRGATFRVTQVIESANRVYLQQQRPSGGWADFDRGGDLLALQRALASERGVMPA